VSVVLRAGRVAMGSEFEVIAWADDRARLATAVEEALDVVERLDRQLSHYRPASDLCDLNRRAASAAVPVEPGFFDLLRRARALSAMTGGAFDITAGPLVRCWGFFQREGRVPGAAELAAALKLVGMGNVELDEDARSVRFRRPGVELHLGAIGKGYAVDRAIERLRELGIPGALVHGGNSSIAALGTGPDGEPWPVGLRDPLSAEGYLATVALENRSLSTSGVTGDFFEVDGKRYAHLIDPRSGDPVGHLLSVSVIADSATDSDALSTAFFVMGRATVAAFCAVHREIAALVVPEPAPGAAAELIRIGIDFEPER
jgi:thiamine biosynthesis lipoprotein